MTPLSLIDIDKSFEHPSGQIKVLKQCQLEVQQGETLAILGPSGSGKSTLLSILAGLDRPSSGRVEVMGQDLGTMSEAQLTQHRAQYMGIVFQQFHLMQHLTALENVALPLEILKRHEAQNLAQQALASVGLDHRLQHHPHECSGGECQRMAIARAIAVSPNIILADEPSGNLDEQTGEQVMQLLFDLVEQTKATLILVTHNKELAQQCQRQLTLSQGKLIEA